MNMSYHWGQRSKTYAEAWGVAKIGAVLDYNNVTHYCAGTTDFISKLRKKCIALRMGLRVRSP